MKKIFLLILFFAKSIFSQSEVIVDRTADWNEFFNMPGIEGTFVLKKINSDTLQVYNLERINKQFLPASTFKIINSLISLEAKAVADENEIIKWDGVKRFIENWNQDQNLKSAIKYSCVWFYQELARRVGREKMQHYVDLSNYGNKKLGDKIDTFWLEGDIRISANEQIEFLTKFLNKDLPFSDRNLEIVKSIMMKDSTDCYKYYAKTGWTARVEKQIGWYVGFIETKNTSWIFAMNIDFYKDEDAKNRIKISEDILKKEGILE
jgi:beta-lactamase class D